MEEIEEKDCGMCKHFCHDGYYEYCGKTGEPAECYEPACEWFE